MLSILFSFSAFGTFAQKTDVNQNKKNITSQSVAKTDNKEAVALANAAIKAHGGDKFKDMKTLIVNGSADVTASVFSQTLPATFVTIFSGDKYRIEINSPLTPFKQVYDGQETSSTIKGNFTLPPLTNLGFPLLAKSGKANFVISALPDDKKSKKGFRVTSPEGFFTDFYVDGKTGQIKSYEASYDIGGRTVTTSVEIDKYRTVDGIILPERYAQRFDTEQMTVYADFKAKEISVNKDVADTVFSLTQK